MKTPSKILLCALIAQLAAAPAISYASGEDLPKVQTEARSLTRSLLAQEVSVRNAKNQPVSASEVEKRGGHNHFAVSSDGKLGVRAAFKIEGSQIKIAVSSYDMSGAAPQVVDGTVLHLNRDSALNSQKATQDKVLNDQMLKRFYANTSKHFETRVGFLERAYSFIVPSSEAASIDRLTLLTGAALTLGVGAMIAAGVGMKKAWVKDNALDEDSIKILGDDGFVSPNHWSGNVAAGGMVLVTAGVIMGLIKWVMASGEATRRREAAAEAAKNAHG